ncbi:MAG: polyprenyl synthetase family protein [Miniphocaeibacter sp.]|uniref:polyprenyl synthetase family protein n=1 Tax=Miniphocaeibacter sp. TaxID=3100973 RepID=UPI001798DD9B|nr:polyprenyl synthetase family protein [Gallicola sp.]
MKSRNNFKTDLQIKQNIINEKLNTVFTDDDILSKASKYAIINGGKRLRPILLIEFAKLFSKEDDYIYDFAIALELIHNYSLVHDDLPSMDNDDYRRGQLTVHKKFGEDIAILVGDNLLNTSNEIVLDIIYKTKEKDSVIEAGRYLAYKAGRNGMITGQILDISNEFLNSDQILDMYNKKTCGLIMAACKCGAILGKANSDEIKLAEEFGYALGLSFQIQDDILDYEEDKKIGKITFANYTSKDNAERILLEYSNKALGILNKFKKDTYFLNSLVKYLINRDI